MRFLFKDSLVSEKELEYTSKSLKDYLKHLRMVSEKKDYSFDESSINLSFDENLLSEVENLKNKKVNPKLRYIIDIGIGGSNLGAKAVYDALFGYSDLLEPDRYPKIIFADTVDPEILEKIGKLLQQIEDPDELLINAISKSGGTTETIVNLEVILAYLKNKFPEILERLVITTDTGSKMEQVCKQNNIDYLTVPKLVGGRYSVFSAVGLFPLLSAGVDIKSLREGAKMTRDRCLNEDILSNPALISAIVLYLENLKGKVINDNFFFHPELESIGKWYRQLMGESIGKEENLEGLKVNAGITPTVSLGSTDLHSMAQLYFGGPKDKVTTFIYTSSINGNVLVPLEGDFLKLVDGVSGKSVYEVMGAIYEGVKATYRSRQIPFMEVILEDLSEKSLGQFLQFKMIEMMFLGKLLKINSFDQPNVEEYKIATKKILLD